MLHMEYIKRHNIRERTLYGIFSRQIASNLDLSQYLSHKYKSHKCNNAISSNKYKPDTTLYTVVAKMDYILDGIFGFKLKID